MNNDGDTSLGVESNILEIDSSNVTNSEDGSNEEEISSGSDYSVAQTDLSFDPNSGSNSNVTSGTDASLTASSDVSFETKNK